jgi:DNA polymerase III subunit alpha
MSHQSGCGCGSCKPKKKLKKVAKTKKIVKATESDLKQELKKAKSNIKEYKLPIMEEKYSGIIKANTKIKLPKVQQRKFVPLHCHSDYSVKDCVMSIDEYVDSMVEMGFPGGSLTEHGNMSSSLKFFKAMKKKGLKPIIGNEIYTDDYIEERIEIAAEKAKKKKEDENIDSGYLADDYGHLLLLAPTAEAYHELLHVNAKGFRDGFYKRPRVTHDYILNQASKHMIATSGCLASKFNYFLRNGEDKKCRQLLDDYHQAFGDRFYVELHFNELEIQRYTTKKLLGMAKELGIPWIVALDAHYAKPEHARFHDYLKMIHYGGTIKEPSKFLYNTRELYVKGTTDIIHSALKWEYDIDVKDIERGLDQTMEIYDRTNFEMELGVLKFPKFNPDPKFDPNAALKKKCIAGFHRRKKQGLIPPDQEDIYTERFKKEFPVIVNKGFADYFLVVSDLTDYCRNNDLFRGAGRGSAAGSVISWFLGITEVDPIKFGLFFERFLNEDRADPPDIDLDFDSERRHEIEERLVEKYGQEKVAHIMSFGTFAAKGVVRDLSRVFELPFPIIDKICKMFEDDQNIQQNLDRIIEEGAPSDILEFIEKEEEFWSAAKFLEGKVRHYSLHAAGVVVTPGAQEDYVPVNRVSGQVVTGFQEGGDIREISDIGLLKIDALGLNNCTIIYKALESIKRRKNKTIDIWAINLEDDNLFERFRQGHTSGIFQFESSGITKFIKDLQPTRFEDLVIVNAAYRPGTLKAGGVDMIIENRHKENIEYAHPLIEEVLGPTYNVLVYQEQQMALMNQVGGFTMVEADKSRKTIKLINKASTASPEQLQKFYDMIEHFMSGAQKKTGLEKEKLQSLVDAMAAAADYSFNKSHSCSYAILAMQNMYLKHYYPADYAAAFLTRTKNEEKKGKKGKKTGENKVEKYVKMARDEMGLIVGKPDINLSGLGWRVKNDKEIIPSLNFIKGVGDKGARTIGANQPYVTLEDFFASDIEWRHANVRVIGSLIKTGAFDSLYPHRKTLLEAYSNWNKNKNKQGVNNIEDKKEHFLKYLHKAEQEIGKETFDLGETLDIEKELYGFYFSGHPLDKYKEITDKLKIKPVGKLAKGKKWKKGSIYGIITKAYPYKIKTGYMCFVDVEDQEGNKASITVWPNIYKEYQNEIEAGNAVAIKVKPGQAKNGDPCFYIDESDERKKVIMLDKLLKRFTK